MRSAVSQEGEEIYPLGGLPGLHPAQMIVASELQRGRHHDRDASAGLFYENLP
jgi:hypothetical protein